MFNFTPPRVGNVVKGEKVYSNALRCPLVVGAACFFYG